MANQIDGLTAALADRYRVERELGAGGMATVFLAEDLKHERKVAIKVLRPELAATLGPERFTREIKLAAQLQHPHVLPLHDSGEANGFLYYVMPYVQGESLREKLDREGELPIADVIRLMRDVTDALEHAHAHGIVHRDIKPNNVMLSGRHALVTDFGVAKAVSEATGRQQITTAGMALGTPAYMSPEQATASPHIDHRTDIYAFAVVAYELLAGRPPFTGATPQAVLAAQVTETAEPVTKHREAVPQAMASLVAKCLEKKPADRYQSAAEVLSAIEAMTTPSGGTVPVAVVKSKKWMPALVAVGAALVLAMSAVVIGAMRQGDATAGAATDGVRVAVVPFVNQTSVDSMDAYGVIAADMITNGLVRVGDIRVVPSASLAHVTSLDPRTLHEETGSRFVVHGALSLQFDSLYFDSQIIDAEEEVVLATIPPVGVPEGQFRSGLERLYEAISAVLAAHVDEDLSLFAQLQDLPMSLDAYRAFASAARLYWALDYDASLNMLYRAYAIDSTSLTILLHIAGTEWNANGDIAKTDSILRLIEPSRHTLAPYDLAFYDFHDGFVKGDREAAHEAGRRLAELGLEPAGALSALMTNRVDEAEEILAAGMFRPGNRKYVRAWELSTRVHHIRGDHDLELIEAHTAVDAVGGENVGTAWYRLRALAGMGRISELRSTLDILRRISPQSRWFLATVAELDAHGHDEAALAMGQLVAGWYTDELERNHSDFTEQLYAETLTYMGAWQEAATIFRRLVEADPANETSLGYLGIHAVRSGYSDSAEVIIERLMTLDVPYMLGSNVLWAARVVGQMGNCQRAVGLLHQAYREGSAPFFHYREFEGIADCPEFQRFMAPR